MALAGLDVLFGAPAGQILGEELDRTQAESLARIALDNSQARLHNAQAAEKELEASDQQWLQGAMRDFGQMSGEAGLTPTATGEGLGQALTNMAMTAYNSGRPALAAKYGKLATEITANARSADLRLARQRGEEQKTAYEMLDRLGGIAGSVTDQQSWNQQRMLVQANPQWGIDLSGLPERYEEALPILQALSQGTVKMKDRLSLQAQEADRKRKEEADAKRTRYQDRIATVLERNATVREDRLKQFRKYAGKPVGAPSSKGVDLATEQVKRYADELGVSIHADDKALMIDTIASRAAGIMKATPGLTLDEATLRAMQEAKDAKDFSVDRDRLRIGLPEWAGGQTNIPTSFPKLRFEGRGKSAQAPLPLPANASGLTKGKWYNLPQGPGLFNGVDFDLAEPSDEEED